MPDNATTVAPTPALPLFAGEYPLWAQLLIAEIARQKEEGGKARVALHLGFKRAYVSRVVATLEGRSSGFPKGVPQNFVDRVIQCLHIVECPATLSLQPRGDCRKGSAPAPTHNPLAMRIWRQCQNCPNKLAQEVKP